jgi:hypothetical protein
MMIIVAVIAVAAAGAYFALSAFVLPHAYLSSPLMAAPRPAPVVTEVSLSDRSVALGQSFRIRVNATNQGEHADLQLVSIAFPNATSTGIVKVESYTFRQSPIFVNPGRPLAAGYQGSRDAATAATVPARYPAVEAWSMPWDHGESFGAELRVTPQHEGRFVVFVKAVGLPHSHNGAHYPQSGIVDQQGEYVAAYEVNVAAKA